MKLELVRKNWDSVECDALIIPLFEEERFEEGLPRELDEKLNGLLSELKNTEEWSGKIGQNTILYHPPDLPVSRLLLMGAGKRERFDNRAIRFLLMRAVHRLKGYHFRRLAVYRRSSGEIAAAAQAAVEGVILATYDPGEYKTQHKSRDFVQEIVMVTSEPLDTPRVEAAMERGRVLGQAANLTRTLVNEPGNLTNPSRLAERAREIAEKSGLEIEILGEPEMRELGMNAVLAVAQGSDEPARFVVLRHRGPNADQPPVVFIGKGVTFDSGGLSLKPALSMEVMKTDKAGGCAVLAALRAIALLQVPQHIVGLIPIVENLPSGRAQRPGDVVRTMSGKTVEVINTDAEGRLLLADAITYALRLKPRYIVDVATLTGACIVALGHVRAGLFSNDEALCEQWLEAAARSGERFWRLPLDEEYREELDSDIADLRNVGSRWGGAITAAKFLQEFVEDTPWCHVDMAGVDIFIEPHPIKGPTGFGARTLVEMALLGGGDEGYKH